jgi:hypothetical protein
MLPLPFHDNVPEGLALLLAGGRLSFLQSLDLSRLGSWRFLREQSNHTLLADAISTGGLPRLNSFSITDDGALLEGLRLAFESRHARLQPSTEAKGANLERDGGNDDDDEQGVGEEIEEGDHPSHRQAMNEKLVVRMRSANYAGIVALLQVSFFCRLECLEFGVDLWSNEADGPVIAALAAIFFLLSAFSMSMRSSIILARAWRDLITVFFRDSNSSVLIIDPVTNTANTTTITGLSGSNKWLGGVLAPNGKIYGIPEDSSSVLRLL